MSFNPSRRRFLQGLGATVALPLMPSLGYAQNASFPKRIVFFYSPVGTIPFRWVPSGGETNFTLSDILQPLQAHRDDIIVLDGIDMRVTSKGPGAAHQRGMGAILTGRPLNDGTFGGGGGAVSGWASGISIDQEIANQRNDPTKFHSLQLGIRATGGENRQTMTYAGSDQPIMPDNDPYNVFNRLFADLDADPFDLERIRIRRASVLDHVLTDIDRLNQKISAEDRPRLDAHLESVRKIETRLNDPQDVITCQAPTIGMQMDPLASDNFPATGELQIDLLVNALACDLTRVASIQFSRATSGQRFDWIGITDSHHSLSHEGDSNTTAVNRLVQINQWYAEQFASLLTKMKAVQEGDGTLLDHSVVVWVNSLGKGNSHTRNDIPLVMAGSCHGFFRTGRFLQFGDEPHNNLLVSLANAMDVNITTFGDPDFCTGPIAALR